eukprot:NODE_897_length_2004_cov_52.129187_g849_i0.p1 GENE.NODE_897_length_2004_cov_52.129187_g849_i0~~NODE_897_length_2004_cov_52.129187_g849_i0.p1  ORF type:complete len:578 (+),score=74.78 NODE_897_length_2004_cov_52.129187_g849_i0:54-1736(+)
MPPKKRSRSSTTAAAGRAAKVRRLGRQTAPANARVDDDDDMDSSYSSGDSHSASSRHQPAAASSSSSNSNNEVATGSGSARLGGRERHHRRSTAPAPPPIPPPSSPSPSPSPSTARLSRASAFPTHTPWSGRPIPNRAPPRGSPVPPIPHRGPRARADSPSSIDSEAEVGEQWEQMEDEFAIPPPVPDRHWLFSRVPFQEMVDNRLEREYFTCPIWTILLMVGVFALASLLYTAFLRSFDTVLLEEAERLSKLEDNPTWPEWIGKSELLASQWLPTRLVLRGFMIVNTICRGILFDGVVADTLCPNPFPGQVFAFVVAHPFQSWIFPVATLHLPRTSLLLIGLYGDLPTMASYMQTTWYWFAWLLAPHAVLFSLIWQHLFWTFPAFFACYALVGLKCQIDEYKHVLKGSRVDAFFHMLDGMVATCVLTSMGIVLPNLAQTGMLLMGWVRRIWRAVHIRKWLYAPPSRPFTRQLTQQIGRYIWTAYRQETRYCKAANYPLTHTSEITTTDELQCVICCSRKKDTALVPCCHVMCKRCADKLPKTECPFCHTKVQYLQFVRV